ncbi:MAG: undecaprenyl/decaprenyl-phosphate alpha-N-acetylglucosaminyl 1-phosphate transferase [Candidatus Doudnabacteria bacterium]|nr:undecaprenyl/decaprenyl-phosphate alpha-N-acetylglucosaminyl 1-phosphate transferase [Candidatus Doudnabacteria bacterium]
MLPNRELYFVLFFVAATLFSFFATKIVRRLARHLKVYDVPRYPRQIHTEVKPKLGGLAVFITLTVGLVALALLGGTDEIGGWRLFGLVIGGVILILGGALDDKYDLPPGVQILFPFAAAALVVLAGAHISYITNPLGGKIILDQYKILGYPVFGSLLVFLWILGITYTTKFLDALDGLVSGISGIAALVIFAVSLAPQVNQTTTAFIALIFAGASFGFLPHNFFPAKIFLGEGGSTLAGFVIAVLAVISGAKIATALLVLGIPILDAVWVIARRLWFHSSPFVGDKKHLPFRLYDIGLSQRQAVLLLYFFAAAFGGVAVFLQSLGKLVALLILSLVMAVVAVTVVLIYRRKRRGL